MNVRAYIYLRSTTSAKSFVNKVAQLLKVAEAKGDSKKGLISLSLQKESFYFP